VFVAALLSGALAMYAADEDNKIKSVSFSIQPAHHTDDFDVTSSDGANRDKIVTKARQLVGKKSRSSALTR